MRHRDLRRAWFGPERPLSDDGSTKDVDAFQEVDERGRIAVAAQGGGRPVAPLPPLRSGQLAPPKASPSWQWMDCESLPPWFARDTPRHQDGATFLQGGPGGLEPWNRIRQGTSDRASGQGPQINRSPASIFFRVPESGALRNSRNGAMARKRDSISENRRGVVATAGGSST